jgi:hypothetical protein
LDDGGVLDSGCGHLVLQVKKSLLHFCKHTGRESSSNAPGGKQKPSHECLLRSQFERQSLLSSALTTPAVSVKVISKTVKVIIRMLDLLLFLINQPSYLLILHFRKPISNHHHHINIYNHTTANQLIQQYAH